VDGDNSNMSEADIERIRNARAALGGTYLSQKQKNDLAGAAVAAGKDPMVTVATFEVEAHQRYNVEKGEDLRSAACLERIEEDVAKAIAEIGQRQAEEEAAVT
jgi:hypothetical protein